MSSSTPASEELSFNVLDARFTDATAAAEYLESIRWPNSPVCPHCGESERKAYRMKHKTRRLWKCAACRKQFTVTVGTIFESSHVPLNKWLLAFYLLCSSKKGLSAHQLHRMLGVTYKTAWFMAHRIREAMKQPPFTTRLSGTVEVDETYVGGKVRRSNRRLSKPLDPMVPDKRQQTGRGADKAPVVALVERGGMVRSLRVANVTAEELGGAIRRHVSREAHLRTDSFPSYTLIGREYASHETVDHNREYVRGDAHTNTAENFFSISSAESMGSTITSARHTCRGISVNSTSATTREQRMGSAIQTERDSRFRWWKGGGCATPTSYVKGETR